MGQSPETPQQIDMFTGEAVDNRTRTQKRKDRQRRKPKQDWLFSQRDMAQFGVNPRPLFSLSPHMTFDLLREDPRTEEEKERDLQRQAEARNNRLFEEPDESDDFPLDDFIKTWADELTKTPENTLAWIVLAGLVAETDLVDEPVQEKPTATAYRVKQTPQGHKLRQPIINQPPPCRDRKYKVRRPKQKYLPDNFAKPEFLDEPVLSPTEGYEAFDFSDQEQIGYVVTDGRFQEFLMDEATILRRVAFKPRYFGDFLSVTLCREWCGQSQLVTFYGLGVHLQRKCFYHQTWFWDVQQSLSPEFQKALPKDGLQQLIELRREAIAPSIAEYEAIKQSELDSLLASLKADDGNVEMQRKVLQTLDDLSA